MHECLLRTESINQPKVTGSDYSAVSRTFFVSFPVRMDSGVYVWTMELSVKSD